MFICLGYAIGLLRPRAASSSSLRFFFRHEDDDGPACVFLSTKGKQDHKCTFPWLPNRNGFAALEVVYAIICQRADGSE